MNITENISTNIKKYRKELGLSQESLAEKLNVTSQAVSKWECAQSVPDIEIIVSLCELFGITADEMLLGKTSKSRSEENREGADGGASIVERDILETLPDDDIHRVLQFKGRRHLRTDELDPNGYIPIEIRDDSIFNSMGIKVNIGNTRINIEGNVRFNGSAVNGDISCGDVDNIESCSGDISCGDVKNISSCEGDISCGNVESLNCEGDVSCGNVANAYSVGGDMSCGAVEKIISVGGDISCKDVGVIETCGGDIDANDIENVASCEGDIECERIGTVTNCSGDIECDHIDNVINCNYNG